MADAGAGSSMQKRLSLFDSVTELYAAPTAPVVVLEGPLHTPGIGSAHVLGAHWVPGHNAAWKRELQAVWWANKSGNLSSALYQSGASTRTCLEVSSHSCCRGCLI